MAHVVSDLLTASEIARIAEVGASTVSNWRRRHPDFPPAAASGAGGAHLFDRDAVMDWLDRRGRSAPHGGTAAGASLKPELRIRRFEDPDAALRTAAAIVALFAARPSLRARAGTPAQIGAALTGSAARLPDHTVGAVIAAELGADSDRIAEIAALLAEDPRSPTDLFEALLRAREHTRLDPTTLDRSDTRLARLVADLVAVEAGKVFDPATGEGGFLLECARRGPDEISVAGRELNERARATAMLRLAANRVDVEIEQGSSLSADRSIRIGETVTAVVCDPPLGEHVHHRYWDLWTEPAGTQPGEAGHGHWRLARRDRNADPAWLLMAVDRLAAAGRACVLQSPTSLHRPGVAHEVRRELLQADLIEAVALVPAGGDRRDREPVAVWVLRPFGERGTGRVLLADAVGTDGDVATAVLQFRAAPEAFEPQHGFAVSVAVEQILQTEEANLLPSRWLALSDRAPDLEEADHALGAAHRELAARPRPQIRMGSRPDVAERRRIRVLIEDGSLVLVRGIAVSPSRAGKRHESLPRHDTRAHPILDAWSFDGRDDERPLEPPAINAPEDRLTRTDDVVVAATSGPPRAQVERHGGRILIAPIQLLRIIRPVITPHVLKALINDPRTVRAATGTAGGRVDIRDIELPLLDDATLAELDSLLRELDDWQHAAHRLADSAARARDALLASVL